MYFNSRSVWYEGSVLYEIHPSQFPDSNDDGFGDLRGLSHRIDYLNKLGVIGVRLNSIFPSKKQSDHFQNITTLLKIDGVLGSAKELEALAQTFHNNNIRLILDLPIYPLITKLEPVITITEESTKHPLIIEQGALRVARASSEKNTVEQAINLWMQCGIDGFYIKGLENMYDDPLLLENIRAWKTHIGPNRILIVNNQLLENVDKSTADIIVKHVDLVDIFIDVTNGTQQISQQINRNLNGILRPGNGAFIQWSIGGVSELQTRKTYELTTNGTLAATLMSLMLPGSPNVYHGDGSNQDDTRQHFSEPIDSKHMHHLPAMAWNTVPQVSDASHGRNHSLQMNANDFDAVARMIELRDLSPSIYKNIIRKKDKYESNTSAMYHANGNILIIVRWYPRRNTFASISNFGNVNISLDLTNYFYSGQIMIGNSHEKIYFDQFEIGPSQTIVVKLDK